MLHENIDILVPGQQVELNQLIAHLTDTAGIVSGCCQEVEISFKISGSQPQNIATHILRKLRRAQENTAPQYKALSRRELEVLSLILDGKTNKEIAEELFISFDTVKTHRKNILQKTGAKNTPALFNIYHNSFNDNNTL